MIDDIDVEVVRARFVRYDFEGKSDGDKTCLLLTMKDPDGNEHAQYFSAGDPQYFVPSEDPKDEDLNGVTIVPVGDKQNLNGGTNCALLLNSLVQAGFPEDLLDSGDVRVLEGLKGHVNQVAQPSRSNLPKKPGQKDRTPMVLLFTSIISLPGEQKAAATKTAKTAAATTKPNGAAKPAASATARTASPSSSVDETLLGELGGEIMGLFAEKGVTTMKRVDITKGLFSSIDKSNANKSKIIQAAGKEDYLKALEGFTFDGSAVSVAE